MEENKHDSSTVPNLEGLKQGPFGSFSPDQLRQMLVGLRALPEWKTMIEQEAEHLGLFDDGDEDEELDHIGGDPEELKHLLHDSEPSHLREKPDENHDALGTSFDSLVRRCRDGWTFGLKRMTPVWAQGFLADYECDGDDPLTMRQIEQDWGGGKFASWVKDEHGIIRGRLTFVIAGPCRHNGIPVFPPNDPRSNPVPSPNSDQNGVLSVMISEMMKLNSSLLQRITSDKRQELPLEQLDRLFSLAERFQSRAVEPAESSGGMGGDLAAALELFKALVEGRKAEAHKLPAPPVPPA